MNKTKIEWVKNPDGTQGSTWNPITGCLNGCSYCYAKKLANGRLRERYLANTHLAPKYKDEPLNICIADGLNPFYPRFWEDRFRDFGYRDAYGCQTIRKPKGIFVCDMGELFGGWIPSEWQRLVFEYIKDYPEHRFYLLTKQPQNLIQFSPFPDNCWPGVTITEAYPGNTPLAYLAQVEASVKYISFEPLLKWGTDLTSVLKLSFEKAGINWVIIGAQTKPYKPPRIEWVEEIVQACDKAGIPVFLKDNLLPLFEGIGELPWAGGNYRQEMPGVLCKTG